MESSIPPISPEQTPENDTQALEEVKALEQQKQLEATERRQEHQRREVLRTVFARGVGYIVAILFLLIAVALVVVAWHYLAPAAWHWMDDEALGTVSTVLFSGTLYVFLGLYVRDRVSS